MTYYPFERPSALESVGCGMDFWGALSPRRLLPAGEDADRDALASDGRAIMDDFRKAFIVATGGPEAENAAGA
ncbi:MAG: hypothetical protein FWE09_00010 [Treponema sp.]|nr:hypothetical protein [Treponema sp.]